MHVQRPFFFIIVVSWGFGFFVVLPLFLFMLLNGGFRHAWDEFWDIKPPLAIHNTTNTTLCFDATELRDCFTELKPHAVSSGRFAPCSGGDGAAIRHPETDQVLYERGTSCGGFRGGTIIISERDGEFVVVDSLPLDVARQPRPSTSP